MLAFYKNVTLIKIYVDDFKDCECKYYCILSNGKYFSDQY